MYISFILVVFSIFNFFFVILLYFIVGIGSSTLESTCSLQYYLYVFSRIELCIDLVLQSGKYVLHNKFEFKFCPFFFYKLQNVFLHLKKVYEKYRTPK